jgi:hypothetical protein
LFDWLDKWLEPPRQCLQNARLFSSLSGPVLGPL